MRTGEALLADIVGRGGQLDTEGERLRLRGSATVLDDSLCDEVREQRDELRRLLAGRRALGLTGIQRRLWFLHQLDASGVGYTFSYLHRITGPLDPEKFGAALNEVVAAHPALRAGFAELAGSPVQLIAPEALSRTEVLADPAGLKDFLVRPFDVGNPPLLRSALVQTEPGTWLWGLTVHHLVADGWTYSLIVRQLSEVLSGQTPVPTEADYGDFVAYERKHDRRSAVDHWAELLADLPSAELPHSHPRPPLRTYAGRQLDATLPAPVTDRLSKLAAQEGTTLFAVLLAVHAAVLAKHTGADRVAVGTPYANRPEARFHDTAGCFVSTLVLPVDLTGAPTFRQLAARAGRICTTAWDYADFPYEQLVERLAPHRDTSRNALFQSFFALQDIPVRLRVPGATTAPRELDTGTTQFDIETYLTPGGSDDTDGGMTLTFRYNSDLFAPAEVADLAARWRLLADRLGAEPDRGVHEVPLLSDAERELIVATSRTAMPYLRDLRADEIVAGQAAVFPDRLALVCGSRRLTYGQLDALVTDMAETIEAAGGRGRRIGLQLPRSPEMVAAVLATMRAGATYVPLALDAPADRLARLTADAGIHLTWTADGLRADHGIDPVLSEGAYVLHTSGSTGRPKGVQVGHDALVNLLTSMGERPGLAAGDVLVAVTGLTFDIAMLELLLPLISGATLVVASDEQARDPRLLAELLDTAEATVVQMTPSAWRMLLDTGWPGRAGLRAWCGGEPLSRDLADELLSTCAEVWNLYGPTETTIWSARWRVEPDGPVRIGEPIGNTGLHVLDRHGTALPPGIPGELHISGDGLADGYLGRPEETAARFTTITTEDGDTVRAYRTGDLVTRLRDGTLVCLGRTDDQLKVRGHRVEPEEIEHALRTHPDVRDAVVVLTAGGQLVAHLVAGDSPTEQSLRAHLSGQLPPAIIPERFVTQAELPRTSNGKIDRKALREAGVPESGGPVTEPPRSAEEHLVADVYHEFLAARSVGRLDDFFALGGNSLVASRVLHRLETASGVRIPLHAFMRDATVAAVAQQLTPEQLPEDQDAALRRALALLDAMSETEAAAIAYGPDPTEEHR